MEFDDSQPKGDIMDIRKSCKGCKKLLDLYVINDICSDCFDKLSDEIYKKYYGPDMSHVVFNMGKYDNKLYGKYK